GQVQARGGKNVMATWASHFVVVTMAYAASTSALGDTPSFPTRRSTDLASTTNTDSATLTYSQVSGPCALVSGTTFSSAGAGTCRVQARGAETAYLLAASCPQDVTIAKAVSTTTLGAAPTPTYPGGNCTV